MSETNPFVSWTQTVIGGALEWKKLDNPPPAAPQPDNATAVPAMPYQPNAAYTGPNLDQVNAAAVGQNQTSIGGVVFDKRFLWVSGAALGVAVFIKAIR